MIIIYCIFNNVQDYKILKMREFLSMAGVV